VSATTVSFRFGLALYLRSLPNCCIATNYVQAHSRVLETCWVDRLPAAQHGHVFFDPLRSRLRFLCILKAMQDRVSVATVESIETAFGVWIAIEGGLKVFRDRRFALRCIGGLLEG
jgi:hypothetical protein